MSHGGRWRLPNELCIWADEMRDLSRAFAVVIRTGIARLFGQGSLSVALPTLPVTVGRRQHNNGLEERQKRLTVCGVVGDNPSRL